MAMNDPDSAPRTDSTRLGCGRKLDDVWSGLDDPPDAHEATCPDCQAARASLAELHLAAQEMASADVSDPTLRTDPAVLDGIIAIARSEVRRGQKIPLRQAAPGAPAGRLSVSEQSIVTMVRRTADTMTDVEARRCRVAVLAAVEEQPEAGAATRIKVELSIAVTGSVVIPEVVDTLRSAIIAAAAVEIGVDVVTVDVAVDDIVTAEELAETVSSTELDPSDDKVGSDA